MIDIAVLCDSNLRRKIEGKKDKYSELHFQLTVLWGIKKILVVPVVLSNIGVIPKNVFKELTTLGIAEIWKNWSF